MTMKRPEPDAVFSRLRPLFTDGGRLARLRPVFDAMEHFALSPLGRATRPPFARDPLDVKRYMSLVVVALLPSLIAGVSLFGWRVLLMVLVSYAAGGCIEVAFAVARKKDIAEGFLVTGLIFPLILPPTVPLWMVAVGIVVGVVVGKEVFGGTGRNVFNPAIVGRVFLSLSYPAAMTRHWIIPGAAGPDAVTAATPLVLARRGTWVSAWDLFTGQVPGSVGETCVPAIVAGGLFLVLVGVANWRTVLSMLGSFTFLTFILRVSDPAHVAPVWLHVFGGGILLGAFFLATDPVTSPLTRTGKWFYGSIIGLTTVLIRNYSGYVEGVMFAILLGNICAPLIDRAVVALTVTRRLQQQCITGSTP